MKKKRSLSVNERNNHKLSWTNSSKQRISEAAEHAVYINSILVLCTTTTTTERVLSTKVILEI